MVLRLGQLEMFATAAAESFETRLVKHVAKYFGDRYEVLSERGARDLVREGIKRAAVYKITRERDVCKFVDIMLVHGRYFDSDPEVGWAYNILHDRAFRDSTVRVEALFEEAKKHFGRG